jgi:predicted transcriptional regulator
MLKETYHPNAYLANLRNISLGLRARTKILNTLERGSGDARTIANEAAMHYGVVMHHLKLLQSEGIVRREGRNPFVWTITGAGQKRLVSTG